jgi:hypothetical protein
LRAALNRVERIVQRLLRRHQLFLLRGKQYRNRDTQLRAAACEDFSVSGKASAVRPPN